MPTVSTDKRSKTGDSRDTRGHKDRATDESIAARRCRERKDIGRIDVLSAGYRQRIPNLPYGSDRDTRQSAPRDAQPIHCTPQPTPGTIRAAADAHCVADRLDHQEATRRTLPCPASGRDRFADRYACPAGRHGTMEKFGVCSD